MSIVDDLLPLAVDIDRLRPLPGNPRRGDVVAIAASLGQFGQRKPVVAKRDGTVIAGNHTLAAARFLEWPQLAVVWVDDDEATAGAFALADNRTGDLGTYDEEALAVLVAEVRDADAALLAATGYSEADLAALLDDPTAQFGPGDLDDVRRLDHLQPVFIECPSCGHTWDRCAG